MGHAPTVFEKADRIGGLLRYGIPDFKLDKSIIDRRMRQMGEEGVIFRPNMEVGVTVSIDRLLDDYHLDRSSLAEPSIRVILASRRARTRWASTSRWISSRARTSAMPEISEDQAAPLGAISALGKNVVVIGGGDTGSDCIGTSFRQGAASVTQLEILPQPPLPREQSADLAQLANEAARTLLSSQEEGAEREFSGADRGVHGRPWQGCGAEMRSLRTGSKVRMAGA